MLCDVNAIFAQKVLKMKLNLLQKLRLKIVKKNLGRHTFKKILMFTKSKLRFKVTNFGQIWLYLSYAPKKMLGLATN